MSTSMPSGGTEASELTPLHAESPMSYPELGGDGASRTASLATIATSLAPSMAEMVGARRRRSAPARRVRPAPHWNKRYGGAQEM